MKKTFRLHFVKTEYYYADYELGMKIRKCILENGQCEFTAEC